MNGKQKRVVLTRSAIADACAIVEYIARDSPMNAERLYSKLLSRTDSLSKMPERGRTLPELEGHGVSDVREIIVKPYRVIYRTTTNAVHVLAVLDGRRDLDDLLLERLTRTAEIKR